MKKNNVGIGFAAATAILALISLIVYQVNIRRPGYFEAADVNNFVLYLVLAIVALACAVALSFLNVKGGLNTLIDLAQGALQIAAPALLAFCLISLIGGRAEGLGFIYFSNADVALEVQTAENLSSATMAIANMILLCLATLCGVVASFINLRKKAAEKAA